MPAARGATTLSGDGLAAHPDHGGLGGCRCRPRRLGDLATVCDALPLAVAGETWGDEIYFQIPVHAKPEKPRATVELGDLGYWPPGSAFCIFFGRTPSSQGEEIRPASPVNVFGKLAGDPTIFKKVRSGTQVRVERIQEA